MENNQNQTAQKSDQPTKPIVVENKADIGPKPANTSVVKPADTAKTGTA